MKHSLCILPLVALSACSENPTGPSRMAGVEKAGMHVVASFDPQQLGRATVTNTSDQPHTFTLIVWDATDERNQRDVAHFTRTIAAGETAELTVGLAIDPCVRYQRDLYLDLPKADRYTLSDVANYFLAAPGVFWGPQTNCRNATPLPVTPAPPQGPSTPSAPPVPPVAAPPPDDSGTPRGAPRPPACVSPGTFRFPAGSFIARFPVGFPVPWYPEELGPFAFSVPAGVYHVTAVNGDDHALKQDGTQRHEIGLFALSSGQVIGPTLDVPDAVDVQATDFGMVSVAGFSSFRFLHAGPMNPELPTDSFYPVSLTFQCP